MRCCPFVSVFALAAVAGTIALAQPAKETKPAQPPAAGQPAGQPELQLPPGMTPEDMQACMEAATPGKEHAFLAEAAGVWAGKTKMWMGPDSPPMESECVSTITPMMDGRYVRSEISGDMPGMGPFMGFGVSGFDNVTKQYVMTWVDNCGTGIMNGTGELSSDGATMTWTCTYNCPIRKAPTVMREVERRTGKDKMTLEMYGSEPHTGKEYKMMEIAFTRKPAAGAAAGAASGAAVAPTVSGGR